MKDWKSDLLAIKLEKPNKTEIQLSELSSSIDKANIPSSSIKPLELERRILNLIRRIEGLSDSLSKIADFPLAKGNSKQIKKYKNEINLLKDEFTKLAYKFKPSLVSGTKVPNTNALIIEMKNELQQRDTRYQKLLIAEQQAEHERLNNERELKREKERAEAIKKEKAEERKLKAAEKKKELLINKAQAHIKEYKITLCIECKNGSIVVPCDKCHGTKRLSQARMGIITERFSCGNLKPNCQFCGGLGVFSKQKEALTYECDVCTNGKKLQPCKTCKGTGITINKDGAIPQKELLEQLQSNSSLVKEIQKIAGK